MFAIMKIGNIVTSNKIDADDTINIVDNIDDIIVGLPTLVTSYEWLTSNYDDYDIYDKQLSKDLWWTFARTERRDAFAVDVEAFITIANQRLIEKVIYIFIDPIHDDLSKIKKIIRKLESIPNKIGFKHQSMIYIYGEGLIFGIDLTLLEYLKLDGDKVEKKIKTNCKVFLDDNEILIEYKDNMERLDYAVKYIPYLYSINNE